MNETLKTILGIIAVLLFGGFCILVATFQGRQETAPIEESHKPIISINNAKIIVEVADTESNQTLGLSNRESLSKDTGMLFSFSKPAEWGIWMKDMHFALDILWLDKDFRIITIREHVAPDTYPTIFYPSELASYVLEVNEGFVGEHAIKVGDYATFVP